MMFLKIDENIHNKSTYKCDRCEKIITKKHRIGLYIQKDTETPKKYCDLCLRCFRALQRGIEKGKENETKS